MNRALAHPVLCPVDGLLLQHHAKRLLNVRGGASKLHGASRGSTWIGLDLEVELPGKCPNQLDCRGVGGVVLLELSAAHANRPAHMATP
jgi:hypothetical protein